MVSIMAPFGFFRRYNHQSYKSRWRVIARNFALPIYAIFCISQLYMVIRYGSIIPFARHHPGAPWVIYYSEEKSAFIYSLVMWEFPFACISAFFIPISVIMRAPWEKKIVKEKVRQELTGARPHFEDESKVEPFQTNKPAQ